MGSVQATMQLSKESQARLAQFDALVGQPTTEWLQTSASGHLSNDDRQRFESIVEQSRGLYRSLLNDFDALKQDGVSLSNSDSNEPTSFSRTPFADVVYRGRNPAKPPKGGACYAAQLPDEILQQIFVCVTEEVEPRDEPIFWRDLPQRKLFGCLTVCKRWAKVMPSAICRRISLQPAHMASFRPYLQLHSTVANDVRELSICVRRAAPQTGYVADFINLLPNFGKLRTLRLDFGLHRDMSQQDEGNLIAAIGSLTCLNELLWPTDCVWSSSWSVLSRITPNVCLQRLSLNSRVEDTEEGNVNEGPSASLDVAIPSLTHLELACQTSVRLAHFIASCGHLEVLKLALYANDSIEVGETTAGRLKDAIGCNDHTLRELHIKLGFPLLSMADLLDPDWQLLTLEFTDYSNRDIFISSDDAAALPMTLQLLHLACGSRATLDVPHLRNRLAMMPALKHFQCYAQRPDPDMPCKDMKALERELNDRDVYFNIDY